MVRPQTALMAFYAAFRGNKDHYFAVEDVGLDKRSVAKAVYLR